MSDLKCIIFTALLIGIVSHFAGCEPTHYIPLGDGQLIYAG